MNTPALECEPIPQISGLELELAPEPPGGLVKLQDTLLHPEFAKHLV